MKEIKPFHIPDSEARKALIEYFIKKNCLPFGPSYNFGGEFYMVGLSWKMFELAYVIKQIERINPRSIDPYIINDLVHQLIPDRNKVITLIPADCPRDKIGEITISLSLYHLLRPIVLAYANTILNGLPKSLEEINTEQDLSVREAQLAIRRRMDPYTKMIEEDFVKRENVTKYPYCLKYPYCFAPSEMFLGNRASLKERNAYADLGNAGFISMGLTCMILTVMPTLLALYFDPNNPNLAASDSKAFGPVGLACTVAICAGGIVGLLSMIRYATYRERYSILEGAQDICRLSQIPPNTIGVGCYQILHRMYGGYNALEAALPTTQINEARLPDLSYKTWQERVTSSSQTRAEIMV